MKLSLVFCVLCFAVIIETSYSSAVLGSTNNATTPTVTEEHIAVKKWKNTEKILKEQVNKVVKALLPQILKASENLNLSGNCTRSLMKFLTGMRQTKDWAFKMIDSSGRVPHGIFAGSINTFGDYDTCVATDVPGQFKGQYCLLEVTPPLPERRPFVNYNDEIPEFINVTKPDTFIGEFMRRGMYYYHLNFRTSICVPSTCSKEEIQQIGAKVIESTGIEFDVSVPNCEILVEEIHFSNTEIGVLSVLSLIVFLAISATLIDVLLKLRSKENSYHEKLSTPLKSLMCFSLYTNFTKLMKPDENPDSIKIIHGFKAITILWVILSHNYFYQNFQALSQLLEARNYGRQFFFQLIGNGILSVETFFFISAVLVSYGVTNMKDKKLNIFLFIFRRIWRLTPPYMLVIGCVLFLPYLGSGPVWRETVIDNLTEKCKQNWWANLLFFNNFIPFADMCLNWTWYIPVDTQMYILSLLVLIPLQKNPRLAFMINCVLCLSGIVMTAAFHIYYQLNPVAVYVFMHPEDVRYFIDRGYYRTYLHISTFSVGLCVGYILATKKKIHIPLAVNIFGWFIAMGLGFLVVFGVYDFNQGNVPSMAVSTLFACTNKLAFALGLAWVTLTCMTGYGGVATTILSWGGFVPLSRLTYMTYLVHPIIHFTYLGSTRNPIEVSHRTQVYQYCGTVVLSFLLALVLSLLFEAPFMALEKILLQSKGQKRNDKEEHETNFKPPFFHNESSLTNGHNVHTLNIKNISSES